MLVCIDFETAGIERRPAYPPKPVGVAIKLGGRRSEYFAWGHPEGNTCTKARAREVLTELWAEAKRGKVTLLGHNFFKFDQEVAETHFGLTPPGVDRVDDTFLLAFLDDPNAEVLSLKPLAEKLLGHKPVERDRLQEWIIGNVPGAKRAPTKWGAHIAKAPGALVAPYARGDVDRTYALHKLLAPRIAADARLAAAYVREKRMARLTLQMERDGVPINSLALARAATVWREDLAKLERWLFRQLGVRRLDFAKSQQLAQALEDSGYVDEWYYTPKTNQRSTTMRDLQEVVKDPGIMAALTHRARLAYVLRTFAGPWREMAQANAGRVAVEWHTVRGANERAAGRALGARTGRLSSTPNFQNVPRAIEALPLPVSIARRLGPAPFLRQFVRGSAGECVLVRDYSQQEFRILAHYEHGRLQQAYKDDPALDMHTLAQGLINAELSASFSRRQIKGVGFGILYGMGLDKLAASIGVDREAAKTIRTAYKAMAPGIKELERTLRVQSAKNEPLRTLGGRAYRVEPPKHIGGYYREFEYKLLNTLIQSSAADMTKDAMLAYADDPTREGRLILSVHDELVVVAPKAAGLEELARMKRAMESVPLDLPLLSDGKMGKSWGSAKLVKGG